MTILHAVILGIIEGVTEFLPISSTGHLILTSHFLKLPSSEFIKNFEIVIQLGAILAVVVLYAKKLLLNRQILSQVVAAFIPTAVVGFVLYKIIKQFLLGNEVVVLWALFIGGVLLIIFEYFHNAPDNGGKVLENLSYRDSFIIGLFQSLAVVPGVSRAAATIVGGLILGYQRKQIVEFSFLLAVPTMLAASALDMYKSAGVFSGAEFGTLAIGFIVSFFTALIAIKWLLAFIKTHNFIWFGIYRIMIALVFFWLI